MSDAITRLNAALEGRYRIERELGEGGVSSRHVDRSQRCPILMSRLSISLSLMLALGAAGEVACQRTEIPRVIVIGIDGMGSDNVWRDTYRGVAPPVIPYINRLKDDGAYTLAARIDPLNFSGPNWAGMVTGSNSAEHGVNSNGCTRGAALPTIYEVLDEAFPEHRLAVVTEWNIIACYYDPTSVGFLVRTDDERETADWVINLLREDDVIFTFAYFGLLDDVGHEYGGNSIEYKEKLEAIDREIGRILTAIDESSRTVSTYVILIADHGHLPDGGGHSSANAPVPFIVNGPGVAEVELDSDVSNNQLAPLVAHIFGVSPSPVWSAPLAPFDTVVSR